MSCLYGESYSTVKFFFNSLVSFNMFELTLKRLVIKDKNY